MSYDSICYPFSKVPVVTGPPTSLTWAPSVVSQLLTSYLSPSYPFSFSGETKIGYKRQRPAYVTLLFKNINLYISSLIKSKLPSLTFETLIVHTIWALLPLFVRLLQTVHCAFLPLVLSLQLGIFFSSKNSLILLGVNYQKFLLKCPYILRINCSSLCFNWVFDI